MKWALLFVAFFIGLFSQSHAYTGRAAITVCEKTFTANVGKPRPATFRLTIERGINRDLQAFFVFLDPENDNSDQPKIMKYQFKVESKSDGINDQGGESLAWRGTKGEDLYTTVHSVYDDTTYVRMMSHSLQVYDTQLECKNKF
ncbi:MAG: hypothetical protein ACAH59_01670 [Pseudobdellovibrionaceae bacterium]